MNFIINTRAEERINKLKISSVETNPQVQRTRGANIESMI